MSEKENWEKEKLSEETTGKLIWLSDDEEVDLEDQRWKRKREERNEIKSAWDSEKVVKDERRKDQQKEKEIIWGKEGEEVESDEVVVLRASSQDADAKLAYALHLEELRLLVHT